VVPKVPPGELDGNNRSRPLGVLLTIKNVPGEFLTPSYFSVLSSYNLPSYTNFP
jgi:hypothetical protein